MLHNLSDKDNGITLPALKADKVAIKLTWNPSTGYYWKESYSSGAVLEEIKHEGADLTPGASATVIFQFRVVETGDIQLYCARPWSKDGAVTKWFTVDLNVS